MRQWLITLAFAVLSALPALAEDSIYPPWPWHYQLVAFPVPGLDQSAAARLSLPRDLDGPYPAVIIAHGSGGVDSRGPLYARWLNESGIATLEIDMWAARGLRGGLDRPDHVRQTLPDAYAARAYLDGREDIQGDKVGLMGFSWGGVMAMLAASGTSPAPGDSPAAEPFAALAALYPVCWGYNRVPGYEFNRIAADALLLIAGGKDDYDAPDDCQRLIDSLPGEDQQKAKLVILPDATHSFDQRAPETLFNDPYAWRGEGGEVRIRYSPAATKQALSEVVGFFGVALGAGDPDGTGEQPGHASEAPSPATGPR